MIVFPENQREEVSRLLKENHPQSVLKQIKIINYNDVKLIGVTSSDVNLLKDIFNSFKEWNTDDFIKSL